MANKKNDDGTEMDSSPADPDSNLAMSKKIKKSEEMAELKKTIDRVRALLERIQKMEAKDQDFIRDYMVEKAEDAQMRLEAKTPEQYQMLRLFKTMETWEPMQKVLTLEKSPADIRGVHKPADDSKPGISAMGTRVRQAKEGPVSERFRNKQEAKTIAGVTTLAARQTKPKLID